MSIKINKRIRTSIQYPTASLVLRYRACQVFGNLSRCASALGISRQALNQRLTSATKWSNTHDWWSELLDMPAGFLDGNDVDSNLASVRVLPVPSSDDRSARAAAACIAWPAVVARSYQWPDAHKAARDARVTADATHAAETDAPAV